MKDRCKPFRLINSQEIAELEEGFRKNLLLWNDQHALFPLTCSLSIKPKLNPWYNNFFLLSEQEKPIALLSQEDLSVLKQSLFGDLSDCFNSICKEMLMELLTQLLGTQTLDLHTITEQPQILNSEWFYTGAPVLAITFCLGSHSMPIYLHPQWVLKTLPSNNQVLKPKATLQEALATKPVPCQVELKPFVLQLKDMMKLRVGDVIKTDHQLAQALLLKHNQHPICQVELGETNHFKSIQIASSL